jgi:hypothetical protein
MKSEQLEISWNATPPVTDAPWPTPVPGDAMGGKTVKAVKPRCDGGADVEFRDGSQASFDAKGNPKR